MNVYIEKVRRVPEPTGGEHEPEFVFRYTLHENGCLVEFVVNEIDIPHLTPAPLAHGSVKWDACMDVTIGEHHMLHNCGPELDEIDRLKLILAHVYADAREMLGEAADAAGYW